MTLPPAPALFARRAGGERAVPWGRNEVAADASTLRRAVHAPARWLVRRAPRSARPSAPLDRRAGRGTVLHEVANVELVRNVYELGDFLRLGPDQLDAAFRDYLAEEFESRLPGDYPVAG